MSIVFKSDRCIIRSIVSSDFQSFFEMQANPQVMKYADGNIQSKEECKADFLSLQKQYPLENPSLLVYAILNNQKEFIGTVAIVFDQNNSYSCEIGYRLLEKYWGKGYASNVIPALTEHCFVTLNMKEIVAYCYVNNVVSIKVLEKSGFKLQEETIDEVNGLADRKYVLAFS